MFGAISGAISRAVRLMLGAISGAISRAVHLMLGAISRAVHLMLGAKGEVLSRAVRRVKGEIEYFSSRAYRTRNINITTGGSGPPRLLGPATISRKIKIQVLALKTIQT